MLASLMTSTLREEFVDDDQLGKVATGGSQWICETTMEVCMPSSKTNIERFLHLVFIHILTSSTPATIGATQWFPGPPTCSASSGAGGGMRLDDKAEKMRYFSRF
jgi:hypothetical protein